jgi:hypothetical protein
VPPRTMGHHAVPRLGHAVRHTGHYCRVVHQEATRGQVELEAEADGGPLATHVLHPHRSHTKRKVQLVRGRQGQGKGKGDKGRERREEERNV